MNKSNDINIILSKIIKLLRTGELEDWAITLEQIKNSTTTEQNSKKLQILSLYGGAGSINDIVIYKNNQAVIAENNKLAKLTTQLYELCKSRP